MVAGKANVAALTAMFPLVPVRGGTEKSEQVSRTEAPAPKRVTGPVHTPATNVIWIGMLVPAPVLAARIASPAYPKTVFPLASAARTVMVNGTPATCGEEIVEKTK